MPRTRSTRSPHSNRPPVSVVDVVILNNDASTSRRRRLDKSSRSKRRPQSVLKDVAWGGLATLAKAALLFISAAMFTTVLNREDEWKSHYLSRKRRSVKLHVPSGLDENTRRALTINLGGGECIWEAPIFDIPTNIDFYKTLIVGFPSGDKRMIFQQMEALTGWAAKDEWDFEYLGDSNHPFIKANYPHHEGIWGWGKNADQVVMVVRNIRLSMEEYHDILYDLGYAKSWQEATMNLENLYGTRPPIEAFYEWRDLRVMDEANWYGWFIDYWMEGGLMRDYITHKITTPEHWNMLMKATMYSRKELEYDVVVGPDTVVPPSYDPHCEDGDISGGCQPVLVVSAEKLRDYTNGPSETELIANLMRANPKMSPYVIDREAWNCVWRELIVKGKGLKTVLDRPAALVKYSFSAEMLDMMLWNLNRTITKYSSDEWNHLATANRVADLLSEHMLLIQSELDDVKAGRRQLTEKDILGPQERERRRLAAIAEGKQVESEDQRKANLKYFDAMEKEHRALKERRVKQAQRERQAQRKEEIEERASV
ncbi:hypothetical protein HJC23_001868 [Cyclotella cryptica]|uniref:Uncharacterized protein n=1 Tax=Cyclotella cryptica TaxID=29204 RepID=A0ABD3PZB8_9STRA|eukprot:CCRYP_009933-RA/>CCRYP_009933-RA protein AED:0.09 eAED:0.09 QI:537/1/1/1/1/1/9/220/539